VCGRGVAAADRIEWGHMNGPELLAGRLLAGKVVVVSGVGPGLGRHIAEDSAAAGASVMLSARSAGYLAELAAELGATYGEVAYRTCDVTSDEECRALVAATEAELGGVDCVVANAFAPAPRNMTLEESDVDTWIPSFNVNFFGSLRLTKAAIPALRRRGGGSIVYIGSQIVRRVRAGRGPYASSKAALLTASHVLARELGPDNIRVNTVVPGRMFAAPLSRYIQELADERGTSFEDQVAVMVNDVSLNHLATDEECARAVVFLCSDLSAAMTGQAIDTNAGETFH
jgi:NAD(P)-dependent dehydrogenase (short-subunit alcohol dehydrogenase family)